MAYIVPASADTREDQRLYTQARMVEVSCLDCLARVRVKKNSEHHTSIQWDEDALEHCTEFNRLDQEPGGRKVYAACPRLSSSIQRAVDEGRLEIGAEDGW